VIDNSNHPIYQLTLTKQEEQESRTLLVSSRKVFIEPQTYKKAIASDHSNDWQQAMQQEYDSLIENQTWDLVSLPPGRKKV